jgi:hypothetical protein
MEWQPPTFVEIKMDAELSSYVDDLSADDARSVRADEAEPLLPAA